MPTKPTWDSSVSLDPFYTYWLYGDANNAAQKVILPKLLEDELFFFSHVNPYVTREHYMVPLKKCVTDSGDNCLTDDNFDFTVDDVLDVLPGDAVFRVNSHPTSYSFVANKVEFVQKKIINAPYADPDFVLV